MQGGDLLARQVALIVAVTVFGGTFYTMRELFKRRSGGLGFR